MTRFLAQRRNKWRFSEKPSLNDSQDFFFSSRTKTGLGAPRTIEGSDRMETTARTEINTLQPQEDKKKSTLSQAVCDLVP